MYDAILSRASERLKASIAWDVHGEAQGGVCHDIASLINAYLFNAKINAQVEPLDIHNWLGENGVQDEVKFNKVQAIVEQIVGHDVIDQLGSRQQTITSLFRKIGYSVPQNP